ncbi:lysine exporter LysO family protein [Aliamphritea ceti]|uniref:lysine exporter LysO family protein n=1 Tax=Aliamphritea ceti TaxID=1524258 RepID=UPI0021C3C681|nr:LysO family transporter [Aliamphritea ceti]
MTVLLTLGPLLLAMILGYMIPVRALTNARVNQGLTWLTNIILAFVGFGIGSLEQLETKLSVAGYNALWLFLLITAFNISALYISGRMLDKAHRNQSQENTKAIPFNWQNLSGALQTVAWALAGGIAGYALQHPLHALDQIIIWLLYILLFLVGRQLYLGNYRLRKLFLNPQGLIIAAVTIISTLIAGIFGAWILDLQLREGLAVVSGFGWYSLTGILLTGMGSPVLGTTAFLLDLGREVAALILIPFLSRLSCHVNVGYSGATALDFTLPLLAKCHGASVIPNAIASGFILSLAVPILVPLLYSLNL